MRDERIKVGNKCYLKAQGNEERYHKDKPIEEWIYEAEITKVGRKYFTVKNSYGLEIQYDLEHLEEKTNYCSDWEFNFTKQEILDKHETEKLNWNIRTRFKGFGVEFS